MGGQALETGLALRGVQAVVGQRLQRHREAAIPVRVECRPQVGGDLAHREQVEIEVVALAAAHEISVRQVAPTDDGRPAVGNEQLVVHAPVELTEVRQQAGHPQRGAVSAGRKRVVQPYLDVGLGGQAQQQVSHAGGIKIVDQQPHPYTPARSIPKGTQDLVAGGVVAQVVGLKIDADSGSRPGPSDPSGRSGPAPRVSSRPRGAFSGRPSPPPPPHPHRRWSGRLKRVAVPWSIAAQRSRRSSSPKRMPSGSISNCLSPASTAPATRAPMPRPWAMATVRAASAGATKMAKPAPMLSVL